MPLPTTYRLRIPIPIPDPIHIRIPNPIGNLDSLFECNNKPILPNATKPSSSLLIE